MLLHWRSRSLHRVALTAYSRLRSLAVMKMGTRPRGRTAAHSWPTDTECGLSHRFMSSPAEGHGRQLFLVIDKPEWTAGWETEAVLQVSLAHTCGSIPPTARRHCRCWLSTAGDMFLTLPALSCGAHPTPSSPTLPRANGQCRAAWGACLIPPRVPSLLRALVRPAKLHPCKQRCPTHAHRTNRSPCRFCVFTVRCVSLKLPAPASRSLITRQVASPVVSVCRAAASGDRGAIPVQEQSHNWHGVHNSRQVASPVVSACWVAAGKVADVHRVSYAIELRRAAASSAQRKRQ